MEPVGRISMASGPIQASNDAFSITVTGQACHGAAPEEGKDATVAAAAVVMALQSVASRRVAPLQPLCITVGQLHSGTRYNIVSGKAVMDGTIRCFSQQLREEMPDLLQSVAGSTAAAYGCSAQASVTYSADVLCCDEELTQVATQAAQETAPEVCPLEKKMVSEDFASYTRHVPGSFVTLGIGGGAPLHNERMTVDESALKTGVAMHLAMAMRLLERR